MTNKFKTILVSLVLVSIAACTGTNTAPGTDLPTDIPVITLNPTPTISATATPPPQPEALLSQGDYALFVGDYERAREVFQSTLSNTTAEDLVAKSNLGIGQAYYYLENYGPGLNNLRLAAAANDPAIAARAQYILGLTYTELQRYEDALNAYQNYLALQPGLIDSHVHELRGDLFNTIRDYDQVITSLEEAYRTDPDGGSERLAVKIARAYQETGDLETALALYQDIYNTSDNDYTKAQMDLLIGQIYLSLDQPQQAYTYFEDAVNNYPYTFDAHTALVTLLNAGVEVNAYQQGLVNYYFGNHALAIEAFDRFLASDPVELADDALHFKALATRASGSSDDYSFYEQAIAHWEALIENYPTSPYYSNAWLGIEFTLRSFMNEPQMAAETSLDYVAQRPEAADAPDFLFLAGRAYENADQLLAAAETWARVGSEYPESEEAFRSVYFSGIALVRLDDWASAQLQFSRALVIASQPAEIAAAHLWIGKCQQAQGDISTALDSWKLAQTAHPFGHYSIRAEDILIGRDPFTEPESYNLDPDLSPYRQEAETWVRTTFNLPAETNLESPGMLAYDPRFQRGLEFWSLGQYEAGKNEFEALRIEFSQDPAETFRLIPALVEIGLYRSALVASTQLLSLAGLERAAALDAPEYFSRIRFGAYYLDWLLPAAESENLSPLLVLATIRQESAYEGFAQSTAGARGLMQVMPATGEELASQLNWPEDYTTADLSRPYVSLVFGTNYLKRWRQFFEGDLFAMLAAYNGGPGNTMNWKALTPSEDPDLFLEIIRLEETRNYLRLINEIHYIYRWLYGSPIAP